MIARPDPLIRELPQAEHSLPPSNYRNVFEHSSYFLEPNALLTCTYCGERFCVKWSGATDTKTNVAVCVSVQQLVRNYGRVPLKTLVNSRDLLNTKIT